MPTSAPSSSTPSSCDRSADALDSAYDERRRLDLGGEVRSHDLPPEIVARVAEQLRGHKEIKRAHLVRRVLDHLDEEFPSYVLVVEIKVSSWRLQTTDPRARIVRALASELDVPFDFMVVEQKEAGRLKRRARRLAGAEVYTRR